MSSDLFVACADLMFMDMVLDLVEKSGQSLERVRDDLISSGAYDALYDEATGLAYTGPVACLNFHEHLCATQKHGY